MNPGARKEAFKHGSWEVNGCGSKFNRRGYAGFGPMFPFTRVPFGYRLFEPRPICQKVDSLSAAEMKWGKLHCLQAFLEKSGPIPFTASRNPLLE